MSLPFRSPGACLLLVSLSGSLGAGCTRPVRVEASGGDDAPADSVEKLPEPGSSKGSDTSGSATSQDAVTSGEPGSDSTTEEQGEPTEDPGTKETTSQGTSSGEKGDTGEELCSEAGIDRHCAPVAPPKWSGPIALAQAPNLKGLGNCDAQAAAVEELFDEVTAAPARCVGCSGRLNLPELGVLQLVEFKNDECSKKQAVRRIDLNPSECVRVPRWNGSGREPYWGFDLGPTTGKLTCRPTNPKPSLPEVEKKAVFRGCRVERKERCEAPDETCIQKSEAPTCVYRPGSHDCPAPYDEEQKVLYAAVEDSRGCSECNSKYTPGGLEPRGRVQFFDGPSCAQHQFREEKRVGQLPGLCRNDTRIEESGWLYIRSEPSAAEFSGSCDGVGWQPEGTVKAIDPITLCCARID